MQDDLTPEVPVTLAEAERLAMIEVVMNGSDADLRRYRYRIAAALRAPSSKLAEVTQDNAALQSAYDEAIAHVERWSERAEAAERALATAEADALRKAAKVAQNNQAGATAVFRGIAIAREILALIPQEPT